MRSEKEVKDLLLNMINNKNELRKNYKDGKIGTSVYNQISHNLNIKLEVLNWVLDK